jgi:hypothetical protein
MEYDPCDPRRLDPSHVDERECSPDARAANWLLMLPAAGVTVVACVPLFAGLVLLRAYRLLWPVAPVGGK